MKYTCQTIINVSIETVVAYWKNEDYFEKWQDGFKSIELLSGEKNKPGAKSRIRFEGKQKIELIETIIKNDLPNEKKGLYEHKHMTNTQTTRFEKLDDNRTAFISEVEYTKFNGILIKLMAKIFPGKFKAQSQKWMDQFKKFVEEVN